MKTTTQTNSPRKCWTTGKALIASFHYRSGVNSDKISILNAIWEKEAGSFAPYWALAGVRRGVLYVRPRSAAAAQELQLRASVLARALNKYFGRAWIKTIKTTLK